MNANNNPLKLFSKSIGDGPDVVILHGLFGDHQNWNQQARALAAHFTVHAMDLRNHGRSAHSDAMNYALMADDVACTCEQLQITSARLIGHSMGGKVAMQLSAQRPDLIERLVVVDIAPRAYPHHHGDVIAGLRALYENPPANRRSADESLARHVDDAAIRAFLLKNLQPGASGYELRINLPAIENAYPAIAQAPLPDTPFDKPVLFIKGEQSDYLQQTDRDLVMQRFPDARLKVIGGAGHWPHAEKPDAVGKILQDFLTGI